MLSRAAQATAPVPIYSQKQADELNAIIQGASDALQYGDYDSAKDYAHQLLKRDPSNAIAYNVLGRIASANGDDQQAVSFYSHATELDSSNEQYQQDLFVAQQLAQGTDRALATGAGMVTNRDTALDGVRLLFEAGARTSEQGTTYLSVAKGFDVLDLPTQQLNAFEMVLSVGTESDLKELETLVQNFVDKNQPVGLAYSILGRTQQKLGEYDAAMQSLEKALSIVQERSLESVDDAANLSGAVERFSTELASVYADVGQERLNQNDLTGAETYYTKANQLNPDNTEIKQGFAAAMIARGEQAITHGQDTQALTYLNRAKLMVGDDASLKGDLANAYYRMGNRALSEGMQSLALSNYEKAYDLNSGISGLKRAMADVHWDMAQAQLAEKPYSAMLGGEFETLVKHLQSAFDLQPMREDHKSALADALNEFGLRQMNSYTDYEKALDLFGRAKSLYPDNSTYEANYNQALQHKIDQDNEE